MIPKDSKFVNVIVYNNGNVVEEKNIAVDAKASQPSIQIDDAKPLAYILSRSKECSDTRAAYAELDQLAKIPSLNITECELELDAATDQNVYVSLAMQGVQYSVETIKSMIDMLRTASFAQKDTTLMFKYKTLLFNSGKSFKDWMDLSKRDMSEVTKEGTIRQ